jgi:hypothetical protein
MKKKRQKLKIDNGQNKLPYKHCLNCGTELKGGFCHICGQEAVDKTPTIAGFIMEYLNNAFFWDSKFLRTIWMLIRRPGHLTNEYLAGKFTSQEHPLKLNMFLLFVFITLFVCFAGNEKMTSSVHSITNDERVFSGVQLNSLIEDPEYAKKIQESPRDTVYLCAPLFLVENHPDIISNLETKEDSKGLGLDKWIAVLPQVLIEDEFIVIDKDGYYRFNMDAKGGNRGLDYVNSVWSEMVRIVSQYFPMLLLLTAPFLSISLNLVQRRNKLPHINHFIFALHYTALLETIMICIYVIHLTIAPPMGILEGVMIAGSCVYLAIAFRRVYSTNNWYKAIAKSILTSLIYFIILLNIFIVVFIIACIIIANQTI